MTAEALKFDDLGVPSPRYEDLSNRGDKHISTPETRFQHPVAETSETPVIAGDKLRLLNHYFYEMQYSVVWISRKLQLDLDVVERVLASDRNRQEPEL